MIKEFVTYEQALALKELGYNERGFGFYEKKKLVISTWLNSNSYLKIDFEKGKPRITAPTFSQAFRWFREKHNLLSSEVYDRGLNNGKLPIIHSYSFKILNLNNFNDNYSGIFKTYEEAESACLDKLIEIVKNK